MSTQPIAPLRDRVLWIGGTSGLGQTFFEEESGTRRDGESYICTGIERRAPSWLPGEYVQLDLTSIESVSTLVARLPHSIGTLVFGARMPLVGTDDHTSLLSHLGTLLEALIDAGVSKMLHVSSVAAADHLRAQRGVNEDVPLPPLAEYAGEYDVFKRRSEETISRVCAARGVPFSHVRLSAIFSNHPSCIQVSALAMQRRVGAWLPSVLDCNSARNVCCCLRLLLVALEAQQRAEEGCIPVRQVYYYTRMHGEPVAYGQYLAAYRAANDVWAALCVPYFVVGLLVSLVHVLVSGTPLRLLGRARAIDYLLQVSSRDHYFDNSRIHSDFPMLRQHEETPFQTFARIRLLRRSRIRAAILGTLRRNSWETHLHSE